MNRDGEFCYWCGKVATSREHVPPKCLFPATEDTKNVYEQSFRSRLITVPSCDEHNLNKSNDDEYLMTCLAARVENNDIAFIHTKTKIKRALNRNPRLINVHKSMNINSGNQEIPVLIINVDLDRLRSSFEAVARALFFHEFRNTFSGSCVSIANFFLTPDTKYTDSNQFHLNAFKIIQDEQVHWDTPVKGDNPKVFTYQFSPEDGFGARTLALNFYENSTIYVCMVDRRRLEPYKEELKILSKLMGL